MVPWFDWTSCCTLVVTIKVFFIDATASAKTGFTSGGQIPRPDGLRPPYASGAP